MWQIETYDGSQDLTEFFQEAEKKRYFNNSNPDILLSTLKDVDEATLFLLYNHNKIVGCEFLRNNLENPLLHKITCCTKEDTKEFC